MQTRLSLNCNECVQLPTEPSIASEKKLSLRRDRSPNLCREGTRAWRGEPLANHRPDDGRGARSASRHRSSNGGGHYRECCRSWAVNSRRSSRGAAAPSQGPVCHWRYSPTVWRCLSVARSQRRPSSSSATRPSARRNRPHPPNAAIWIRLECQSRWARFTCWR